VPDLLPPEIFLCSIDPDSTKAHGGSFSAELLSFLVRPDSEAEFVLLDAALELTSSSECGHDIDDSVACSVGPLTCLQPMVTFVIVHRKRDRK